MKKPQGIILAIVGTLGLLLAGQAIVHEGARRMKQIPLTTLKLHPYAFGRFLVDLPEGVECLNWKQEYKGAGPITVSEGITPSQFETIVQQRADELKAIHHEEGGSLFAQEDMLALPNCKQILYWQSALSKLQLECDAYCLIGHRLFKINPMTDPDVQSKSEMKAANEAIFRSMRLRRPDEIPPMPGFCFDGAIITEDISGMKHHSELVMVDLAWKERPDVHFSFCAFGNGERLDPPLLERLQEAGSASGEKVLRSGSRAVGPFQGEEQLARVQEKNHTEGHFFVWESQGRSYDPYNPQLRLDMTTGEGPGGSENASLSDPDALRLWDAIVNSIRIRPASSTTSATEPTAPPKPRAALGTRLRSGDRCVQAGSWTCAHDNNLVGATRVFRKGEELPPAVLDARLGWFGRLAGRPAELVEDTVWTLVGYEDGA